MDFVSLGETAVRNEMWWAPKHWNQILLVVQNYMGLIHARFFPNQRISFSSHVEYLFMMEI